MIERPAPSYEEFELGIMIVGTIEEMDGSDRVPHLKLIASEPWLDVAVVQLERNGALLGVQGLVRSKVLDTGRHC